MTPKQFKPGWPGLQYSLIPGKPDCQNCRNTGYEVSHGAPRNTRTGLPRMDYPCGLCGRDPIKFLHEQVIRKTAHLCEVCGRANSDHVNGQICPECMENFKTHR